MLLRNVYKPGESLIYFFNLKKKIQNLWGSFELKLDALQRMQVMQLRHMTFEEALSDEYLDSTQEMYKNLNMRAINVEATSMDYHTLESKMTKAVEELGIEHIIIDNLQFLLYGGSFIVQTGCLYGIDKFWLYLKCDNLVTFW